MLKLQTSVSRIIQAKKACIAREARTGVTRTAINLASPNIFLKIVLFSTYYLKFSLPRFGSQDLFKDQNCPFTLVP